MQIQPLEQGNFSARAYYSIREGLIAGNFKPGERLVIQDLAERLVSERVLELRSGRFGIVPTLTLSRYSEVRTIPHCLGWSCRRIGDTPRHRRQPGNAGNATRQIRRIRAAERCRCAMQYNREFHFILSRLLLTAQIAGLWVPMGPILNLFYSKGDNTHLGASAHLTLMDALREKKPAKARRAIADDILGAGNSIIAFIDGREKERTELTLPSIAPQHLSSLRVPVPWT